MSFWDAVNPFNAAGGSGGAPASNGAADDVTTGKLGQTAVSSVASRVSANHPLFWPGVFIFGSFALIGISTHLDVGPFHAGASFDHDDHHYDREDHHDD